MTSCSAPSRTLEGKGLGVDRGDDGFEKVEDGDDLDEAVQREAGLLLEPAIMTWLIQ